MELLFDLQTFRGLLFILWISGELSDPDCEERESNDDCCVLVVCSAKEEEEGDGEETDSGGGGEVDRNDLGSQVDSFNVEQEGTVLTSLIKDYK